MPRKKSRTTSDEDISKDLWISPRFSLKGQNGDRAWDHRQVGNPGSARFLELADIALGMRKPQPKKKAGQSSTSVHVTGKPEPYTR
jgi:hypothetical protein